MAQGQMPQVPMAQDQIILPGQQPPVTFDPGADPLTRLREIHLPDPVAFWPPAPGWFMLAGALVLLALLAAFLEWRRRQTLAYRVLQDFQALTRDPDADTLTIGAAAAVLMRRVLLSHKARSPAAALTGTAWANFLADDPKGLPQDLSRFLALAPYLPPDAAEAAAIDRAALVDGVRRWIRSHA